MTMKTKQYVFTKEEVLGLSLATIEYWHSFSKQILKNKDISPHSRKVHTAMESLKQQFTQDITLWKE
jgi:hypothetical protein